MFSAKVKTAFGCGFSSALLFAAMAGCGSGGTAGSTGGGVAPTTFSLTVVNGYGSGIYAGGTKVDVFANTAVAGTAFNAWTGDTSSLADAANWHTTATASAGASLTVTANNTLIVPLLAPTVVNVPGTDTGTTANRTTTGTVPVTPITIGYQIPAAHPSGIVLEFHGKGGSFSNWFIGFDRTYFTTQALAAGFGVVAINSAATGYWDSQTTFPNNVDYNNVQTVVAYLIGKGAMSASDRLYGVGESDGGNFDVAVSRALNLRASAVQIAPGEEPYFDPSRNIPTSGGTNHTMTPTMWVLAQQDGTSGVVGPPPYASVIGIGPSNIAQAYCNAVEVQTFANPVPTCNTNVTVNPYPSSIANLNFYVNPPSPAYPARFMQVNGVTAATAQAVDTWMQAQGCIDANGRILANPYQSADYSASPVNFKCGAAELLAQFSAAPYSLNQAQANQLNDGFLVAYSEHHFMAEFTDKMLAFLLAH